RAGLLAEGKHLAPEKRPELAGRQRLEHATIALAPPSAQLGVIRGPVADTAIDDGFGLHTGTPEKTDSLLTQPRGPRKELARIPHCGRRTGRASNQARTIIPP